MPRNNKFSNLGYNRRNVSSKQNFLRNRLKNNLKISAILAPVRRARRKKIKQSITESLQSIGYHLNEIGEFEKKRHKYLVAEYNLRKDMLKKRSCQSCYSWLYGFNGEEDIDCLKCCSNSGPIFSLNQKNIPTVTIDSIFQELTFIEKLLIARVQPLINVVALPRGGQNALKKHSITFEKVDFDGWVSVLPRLPNEIDILIVCMNDDTDYLHGYEVNRNRVLRALSQLKRLQSYDKTLPYANIIISQERLMQLPENASILNQLPQINDFIFPDQSIGILDDKEAFQREFENFVIVNDQDRSELDEIRRSIKLRIKNATLDNVPLKEECEYFYSMCYPALFPDTIGDITSPDYPIDNKNKYYRKWVGHLLSFADNRFACDKFFRFHCYNITMRKKARQASTKFCIDNSLLDNLTVGQILDSIESGDITLIHHMNRYIRNIEGTTQFKYDKRRKLTAMVKTLGLPKYFCTMSSADIYWPIIQENPNSSSKIRNEVVNNHGSRVVFMFMKKAKLLINEFSPELNITDHFIMYEFQNRGSIHLHALFWSDTDPDKPVSYPYHQKIKDITEASIRNRNSEGFQKLFTELQEEFHLICSAVNPKNDINGTEIQRMKIDYEALEHPSSRMACEIKHDKKLDLCALLNHLQHHTQCKKHKCLRRKKGESKLSCRYGFPFRKNESKLLYFDENNNLVFRAERNDDRLNTYCEDMMRLHRANMDFRPVTSMHAVIAYITKYICKSEIPSEMLKTLKRLAANPRRPLNRSSPGIALLQRYVMRDIGRDISGQEIDTYFLGYSLSECSRTFDNISINPQSSYVNIYKEEFYYSEWHLYLKRPFIFRNLSFVELLRNYYYNDKGVWTRKTSKAMRRKIIIFFPDIRNSKKEDYWKVRCLACIPCFSVTGCLGNCKNWFDRAKLAKKEKIDLRIYLNETDPWDIIDYENNDLPESDKFAIDEDARNIMSFDNHDSGALDLIDENLGAHDFIDKEKEKKRMQKYNIPESAHDLSLDLHHLKGPPIDISRINFNTLNYRQNLAFKFAQAILQNVTKESCIIHGVGGTGKSYIIASILKWAQLELGSTNDILVTAPSGQAASLLPQGQTIHSALGIQVPLTLFRDFKGSKLSIWQNKLSNMKLLIIDEFSMVGAKLLHCLDRRLRQMFPKRHNQYMGGLPILFFGDIAQLPPTNDSSCFTEISFEDKMETINGKNLYKNIKFAVTLTEVKRTEDEEFINHLGRLRLGIHTPRDMNYFLQRSREQVTLEDATRFRNAITLAGTNLEVDRINQERLDALPGKTLRLIAEDQGNFPENNTRRISRTVDLKVGAEVMLIANKNVSVGLCNGSRGRVMGFTFPDGEHTHPVVWVEFPLYKGPEIIPGKPKAVPITHHIFKEESKGKSVSRFQTPLRLAYAMTVHKCQGTTLDIFKYILGKKDIAFGGTYVAFSRAKKLSCLLIIGAPQIDPWKERFKNMSRGKKNKHVLNEQARLEAMFELTENFILRHL